MVSPAIAIVTPSKATYFKPLYEAFCGAQPSPWRTLLLWPAEHESEHPQELLTPEAKNMEVIKIAGRAYHSSGRRKCYFPSRQFFSLLKKQNTRLVWIHEYSSFSLQGLLYAKMAGVPVVVSSEVGKPNVRFFGFKTKMWHRFWSSMVDGVIACSPAAHESLCGKRKPSVAAYHAVDSRLYVPADRQESGGNIPVTFVYLGQLIYRKGLDLWVKAAAALRDGGHTNFKLRFIGTGDEGWLRSVVANYQMEAYVENTGFLSGESLRSALGTGDVFVLPTRQDTYATVVHEAACLGLPLIVSKHAGAAEGVVMEGVNGCVIDPEDTDAFTMAMRTLLDATCRSKMGLAARVAGEKLSAHVRGAAVWEWMAMEFSLLSGQRPVPVKMQTAY